MNQRQCSILFSDVSGFTKLQPSELRIFINKVLPSFSTVIGTFRPQVKNTWGDAIFLVFHTSEEAAECALALRDIVRNKDWTAEGIHTELSMRIGLHNAHACLVKDPITNRQNAFGEHINQAARLEPVVIPNEVFITQGFLMSLQAHNPKKFEWDNVGILPLAKGWGESMVYCLRRKGDRPFSQVKKVELVTRSDSIEKRLPRVQSLFSGREIARNYISKILQHIDNFQLSSGIVRRNWTIKAQYDTDTIQTDGVITERLQWVYELINLSNEPIDYLIELLGSTDLESKADPFSLHRILESGREEKIFSTPKKKKTSEKQIFSTLREVVTFQPGDKVKIELRHYLNRWPACQGKVALIHNSFAPREISFENRLEIEGPLSSDVGIIYGSGYLDPVSVEPNPSRKRYFFNIPSPMLRDQGMEILIKFMPN